MGATTLSTGNIPIVCIQHETTSLEYIRHSLTPIRWLQPQNQAKHKDPTIFDR